jgi:hypothetical protein
MSLPRRHHTFRNSAIATLPHTFSLALATGILWKRQAHEKCSQIKNVTSIKTMMAAKASVTNANPATFVTSSMLWSMYAAGIFGIVETT